VQKLNESPLQSLQAPALSVQTDAQLQPLNSPIVQIPRSPPGRFIPAQFTLSLHGPLAPGVQTESQLQPARAPSRHRPRPPFGSLTPLQVGKLQDPIDEVVQTLEQKHPLKSPSVHLPVAVSGSLIPKHPSWVRGWNGWEQFGLSLYA
jgi:hypothetical protein